VLRRVNKMKEIVVKFEPFVLKQTVFIKDEESG